MIDITTRLGPAKGVLSLHVLRADGSAIPEKTAEFEQIFTDYGFKMLYNSGSAVGTITGGGNSVRPIYIL